MKKVLISTVPFGQKNRQPLDFLEKAGIEYVINPYNKKLTEAQLMELIADFDAIIAGTELITAKVLRNAPKLKLISRVGIGLDGVDLIEARNRGVRVAYTPDAPAPAVAELAVGVMLMLLRSVHISNAQMHSGQWERIFGRRLGELTMGVIGAGRIGSRVLRLASAFGVKRLMVNDIAPNAKLGQDLDINWVTKDDIYKSADLISLHLPLTPLTKDMIGRSQLLAMKADAILVNTSRGGIINEGDLYDVMTAGHLAGAGLDVFEREPYSGPLSGIDRCVLSAHMGSMSVDCRTRMEIEATEEVVRFFNDQSLANEVPSSEYIIQSGGL